MDDELTPEEIAEKATREAAIARAELKLLKDKDASQKFGRAIAALNQGLFAITDPDQGAIDTLLGEWEAKLVTLGVADPNAAPAAPEASPAPETKEENVDRNPAANWAAPAPGTGEATPALDYAREIEGLITTNPKPMVEMIRLLEEAQHPDNPQRNQNRTAISDMVEKHWAPDRW